MNTQGLRRHVDDLPRGCRRAHLAPDDFEAAQIRIAIDLRAARPDGDASRQEFPIDLRRHLAEQWGWVENTSIDRTQRCRGMRCKAPILRR